MKQYKFHRFIGKILICPKKKKLLEEWGWYRNMHGGYTHPHGIDFMSFYEIFRYNLAQLDYKLRYGSCSVLPDNLK